ncbi:MAG TPA: hypothetical protein VG389_09795 [Myxococcota bacterium]|jgi:hypothetical protein|nr:hypothetical protein [Myxococcota bacterium]
MITLRRAGRAAAAAALALAWATGAVAGGCGGGGKHDKVPLTLSAGVSAATDPDGETFYGIAPADDTPLIVSLDPEGTSITLEVIDEETEAVLATGSTQAMLRVASIVPVAGAPLCIRVANDGMNPYAGTLTVEPGPTATIVNVTTPTGGDQMIVRIQNGFAVDVVNCVQPVMGNTGSGTWTVVFGPEDLAVGPFTIGFSLLNTGQVIGFGGGTLPVMEGMVITAAINVTASAGMPVLPPACTAPGMLSPLVMAGSYGTSDLR